MKNHTHKIKNFPIPPDVDSVQREILDVTSLLERIEEDELEECRIEHLILDDPVTVRLEGSRCIFKGCHFQETQLERSDLTDVIFENCDFSLCSMRSSYFCRVLFHDCRLYGSDFSDSVFKDVVWDSSNGAYTDFRESDFNRCVFEDSLLEGANLERIKLKELQFRSTDLRGAQFYGSRLNGVDLSSCLIDNLQVSDTYSELKGAHINIAQAPIILDLLNIKYL